jgi:hypothetical protein
MSGLVGQQDIPKAISAIPVHTRNRDCDPGKLLTEQELTDKRWNNQQR